jgi:hypothetical protein
MVDRRRFITLLAALSARLKRPFGASLEIAAPLSAAAAVQAAQASSGRRLRNNDQSRHFRKRSNKNVYKRSANSV